MKTFSVYGPPGCGKTTQMLERVEAAKELYPASQIAFMSFTKAAANEALKRMGISRSDKVCTIHSMMFRLNGMSSPSVVDGNKLKKFGDLIGFRFQAKANDTWEDMAVGDQFLSILSRSLNRETPLIEEYHNSERPGDWSTFEFFVKSYQAWKAANGFVDFNDMLSIYVDHPVPHGTKVIFIDEAQDLSNLQWRAIEKMIEIGQVDEVHIAGDDDQAVNAWAGANTHGMDEFENRHDSERMTLEQSWRIPQSVHDLALSVLKTIKKRVSKVYLPKPELGLVRRTSIFNHKNLVSGEDTLILCRSHVARKEIEDELIKYRVPYRNDSGLPGLFGSRIAEAIRIFNRLMVGETATESDVTKLLTVADDRTKSEIGTNDFKSMLKRGFARSLVIPPHLIDFYRDADFTAVPTIRLSTIHSAKGREADHVILHTSLTERVMNGMDKDPDSEARVFYVGVTRAKHTLDIWEGDKGYKI